MKRNKEQVPWYRRGLRPMSFPLEGSPMACFPIDLSGRMAHVSTRGRMSEYPRISSCDSLIDSGNLNKGPENMKPSHPSGSWKCIRNDIAPPMDSPNRNAGRSLFASQSRFVLKKARELSATYTHQSSQNEIGSNGCVAQYGGNRDPDSVPSSWKTNPERAYAVLVLFIHNVSLSWRSSCSQGNLMMPLVLEYLWTQRSY